MRELNKTILILDDEQSIINALSRLLTHEGYTILQATTGQDALKIIADNDVALMICDQKMPGMSGAEVLNKVKKISGETVRIMLTGFADVSTFLESINNAQVSQLLLKPWDNNHLKLVVADAIRQYNLCQENKRLEDALKFTQFAVDHASDAAFWVNEDGAIFYMNHTAATLSGYTSEPLEGKMFSTLLGEDNQQEWGEHWINIKKNKHQIFESTIHPQAGNPVPVEISNNMVSFKGKNYYCIFIRDICEKVKNRELREDIERITRHDLKSPLNAIIGIPSLLKTDINLTEKQYSLLNAVEEAGKRMLDMINLNLDLYKMEKGLYHYQPTIIPLIALLKRIMSEMDNLLSIQQLDIKYIVNGQDVDELTTFSVLGEELLCFSMFSNLIKNAIEASPQHQPLTITMDNRSNSPYTTISIHNYGLVPVEIQNTFFDKFATAGKKHGTGLGTYSARLIAETQKGFIEMESTMERGTEVTVHLPKNIENEYVTNDKHRM